MQIPKIKVENNAPKINIAKPRTYARFLLFLQTLSTMIRKFYEPAVLCSLGLPALADRRSKP